MLRRYPHTAQRAGMLLLPILLAGLLYGPEIAVAEQPRRSNSLGMSFVLIPAGSFNMGSPDDEYGRSESERLYRVRLTKSFYLQTTEVTVGQWRALMGKRWFGGVNWPQDRPIARVSWYDVLRFINKLNARNEAHYRLPTEAEWEYAARAGSHTAYAWGDMIDCSRALYGHSARGQDECRDYNLSSGLADEMPAPVKSYPPNAWGLYDMHGNVWEWCQDVFMDYPRGTAVDPCPTESGSMRVRRGGSWFSSGPACRSANRAWGHPASRLPNTGFRLVMEIQPASASGKKVPYPSEESNNFKGP